MKTSSRSNPQPGTLVNIGSRACEPDIVFVGRYRVRRSGRYWNAYVQAGDKWGSPKRFTSRKRTFDAVAEHARSGKWEEAPVDPIGDLQRRVAALETWRDAIVANISEPRGGSIVVDDLVVGLVYKPHPQDDPENA